MFRVAMHRRILRGIVIVACAAHVAAAEDSAPPDYNTHVLPIFVKYCTGCHNAQEAEGKLILESYEKLLAGGSRGAAILPGRSEQSRLLMLIEGRAKPVMPPEGNESPKAAEIA